MPRARLADVAASGGALNGAGRLNKGRPAGRQRLAVYLAVFSVLLGILTRFQALGALSWVQGPDAVPGRTDRIKRAAESDIVVSRKVPLIPRPQKGPRPVVEPSYFDQPHVPDGAERRPGPVRGLIFQKSIMETLESGVDEEQRGGLKGRYAIEIAEHLAARKALAAAGIRENITVFWDHDGFPLPEVYELRPLAALKRYCEWIAGVLGASVTRIETVEYTRNNAPSVWSHLRGDQNLYNSLRQFGGVVHRAWPPMTDGIDVIFFERFRHHLDLMANGGPRSILCLMAEEKGYQAMIEAAQSEGVTVVRVGKNGLMTYYPGAHDFSVPIFWERWRFAQKDLFSFELDPFRSDEEWLPQHGPKKWQPGPVVLEPWDPSEELDRRIFHKFVNKKDFEVSGTQIIGTWRRPGFLMNDTLRVAVARSTAITVSKKKKQPIRESNAHFFREDLEALVEQGPEVAAEAKRDLEQLGQDPEDYAVLLWNHDSHKLVNYGASQREVLARLVRWWEGFLGMPVRRVEAADFVEPWDRLGAHALDWLYQMSLLNITVNRLWPPKSEAINRVLLRQVSRMARAKSEDRWASPNSQRPPRLVIVMTTDMCFDIAIEDAQRAGISAVWMGWRGNGAFYPANTTHRMPFVTVPWRRWSQDIAIANRNPFLEGARNPDNPLPSELAHTSPVPMDQKWGKVDELNLDNFERFLKPQEQPTSEEEVAAAK